MSHSALLSDGLRKLQLHQESSETEDSEDTLTAPDVDQEDHAPSPPPSSNRVPFKDHLRDGYGFRPASGISTPVIGTEKSHGSPLPDTNGLGWPGKQLPWLSNYLAF